MVNKALAESYLKRCRIRVEILEEFLKRKAYADVIRESQEIIELLEKAILIKLGIDPPKWHDVIDIVIEHIKKLSKEIKKEILSFRNYLKYLRTQREIAFYGEADFIPDDVYSKKDAEKAVEVTKKFLKITEKIFKEEKNET